MCMIFHYSHKPGLDIYYNKYLVMAGRKQVCLVGTSSLLGNASVAARLCYQRSLKWQVLEEQDHFFFCKLQWVYFFY